MRNVKYPAACNMKRIENWNHGKGAFTRTGSECKRGSSSSSVAVMVKGERGRKVVKLITLSSRHLNQMGVVIDVRYMSSSAWPCSPIKGLLR